MFVSFTIPYNCRYHRQGGAQLWFFYKQLQHFASHPDDFFFIGYGGNFLSPKLLPSESWELLNESRLEYQIPDENLLKHANVIGLDQTLFWAEKGSV